MLWLRAFGISSRLFEASVNTEHLISFGGRKAAFRGFQLHLRRSGIAMEMNRLFWWIPMVGTGCVAVAMLTSSGPQPGTTGLHELEKLVVNGRVQNPAPMLPEAVDLAGEAVPLNAFGVRDALDRELIVNTYHHSSTMLYLKRAARWFPVIEPILAEMQVPDDFKYLAVIESGLGQAVSPAGAAGFWQFMKATAPQYDLEVNREVDERYHVVKSTYAACQYLLEAREEFGSWALAAASYNMGRSGVRKALQAQQVDNYWDLHLNTETARYVFRLLAIKHVFESPAEHGFDLPPEVLYPPHVTRSMTVEATIEDLAAFAAHHGTHLKALKTLNPWLVDDRLPISQGNQYDILLPAD